jgi:hypothetical protein
LSLVMGLSTVPICPRKGTARGSVVDVVGVEDVEQEGGGGGQTFWPGGYGGQGGGGHGGHTDAPGGYGQVQDTCPQGHCAEEMARKSAKDAARSMGSFSQARLRAAKNSFA